MRYLKFVFLFAVAATLVGCANHKRDYLYQSNSVGPMVAAPGVQVKKGQNYYPVPNVSSGAVQSPPSLVPPGSDLQRFKKKTKVTTTTTPKPKQKLATNFKKDPKGAPVLALPEAEKSAWTDVGRALQATSYKVLDQDRSMASYYILDSDTTGQKITKKTPIYRVYLKANGAKTDVLLLDEENQPVPTSISQRILNALQKKLA